MRPVASRIVTGLVTLQCLSGMAALAAALQFEVGPETTRVAFTDDLGRAATGADERIVEAGSSARFVPLPPGAFDAGVRVLGGGAGVEVVAGRPLVARGLRILPLRLTSIAATTQDGPVLWPDIELTHGRLAQTPAALVHGHDFFDWLGTLVGSDIPRPAAASSAGAYLIITAPDYLSAVAPLAEWKRKMGFAVSLVTTDETGVTNAAIHDFISDRYWSGDPPVEYVLLVGDVDRVPGWDFHSSVSDLPYSLVDGDDFLPDLFVGRLSVQALSEAETVVAKILHYQTDPTLGVGSDWLSRGLMVAGNYGSATPVPISRWCREQLQGMGYTQVDSVYFPPNFTGGMIPPYINAGVSIVSYRGWAYGIYGWEPPHFTNSEVYGLANGWKLPVVFSFVCQNGDFAADEPCFGEAWIRAGTPVAPKGAVGFISNSEPWSHTRFNDASAIGVFQALRDRGVKRLGALLTALKMEVLHQFPGEILYDQHIDESVEFYFYIYNLLGDPELEIWTAAPKPIVVTHPAAIQIGSDYVEIAIADGVGQPVEAGIRVGLTQGSTLLGSGFTDGDGVARIVASFDDGSSPVHVTVTGSGVMPYQADVPVQSLTGQTVPMEVAVDDDATGQSHGNGDHVLNPGERAEITVQLRNPGSVAITGIAATLEATAGASVLAASAAYPDLAPGGVAANATPFVIEIAPDAGDGLLARLRLQVAATEGTTTTGFDLPVTAAALQLAGHTIAGGGTLDPGATAPLQVTLRNDGSIPSAAASATLRARSPALASVVDSLSTLPSLPIGGQSALDTAFTIEAAGDAAVGQAAVFDLLLAMADGSRATISFSVIVGDVDHRAPLGPDAYGYYAYDNTDTDYPDAAPLYDWMTVSPTYGGAGDTLHVHNNVTVRDTLPFPFTYYGRSYTVITVSDNGWISFDLSDYYDFYNWSIPTTYGNSAQVAAFWDNLDPERTIGGVTVADGVYALSDTTSHRYIVEWSRLGNDRPELDDLQTFQLILYDPVYYPTPSGDGIIEAQYKQVVNDDGERMYATVGLEDDTEMIGLEYTYANFYPAAAAPLSAGLCIRFTTTPPRYSPPRLETFAAAAASPGVRVSWQPADARPLRGYRVYREDGNGSWLRLNATDLGAGTREFLDAGADPERSHRYRIGWVDPVGYETSLGPFDYPGRGGATASGFALRLGPGAGNPAREGTVFAYDLPARGPVGLRVHDLSGRLVRTLIDGVHEPGRWSIGWDGRDDRGRRMTSGVYFVRLQVGTDERLLKVTLVQ